MFIFSVIISIFIDLDYNSCIKVLPSDGVLQA
jgi:hypothetical protein